MVETTPDGVMLLGGDRNGLNFEIEYYDDTSHFREAVYSVAHHLASGRLSQSRPAICGKLMFKLDHRSFCVSLPGGCRELVAVRRPWAIGGEDITGAFE
jgi:hypothetical protein